MTVFLIHGLCSPQMDEKWIILSEEVRRPGVVSTIAVSHEPGANFFMATWYILLYPWGYSFHSSDQQYIGSVLFHIYSLLVQKKTMSAWRYLSLTSETALTGENYWTSISDIQKLRDWRMSLIEHQAWLTHQEVLSLKGSWAAGPLSQAICPLWLLKCNLPGGWKLDHLLETDFF